MAHYNRRDERKKSVLVIYLGHLGIFLVKNERQRIFKMYLGILTKNTKVKFKLYLSTVFFAGLENIFSPQAIPCSFILSHKIPWIVLGNKPEKCVALYLSVSQKTT